MEKKIFEGFLLVSDIDGTLVNDEHFVPQRNRDAIARFCALGGKFAIASGRSSKTAGGVLEQVTPNAPCILLNGAEIFDLAANKPIMQAFLPIEADAYITQYFDRYPNSAAVIFTTRGIFVARPNALSDEHDVIVGAKSAQLDWKDLPADKFKLLLMDDAESIQQMKRDEAADPSPLVETNMSWPQYFEFLPRGANKGTGLIQLCAHLGIPRERSFAIGDYNNDSELLRAAGFSAVPQNGQDELKEIADITVCHCNDGAVADLIEYIEQHFV